MRRPTLSILAATPALFPGSAISEVAPALLPVSEGFEQGARQPARQLPARPPQLGPATPVDVRVESVNWHPRGEALLYTRSVGESIGIGTYVPGKAEGKVLVHLNRDDRWEAKWFEGSLAAIVNVYRVRKTAKGDQTEANVYVLDARAQSARGVFSRLSAPGQKLDLDVDPSPCLTHAIFRVREGEQTRHFVLRLGSGTLTPSAELDAAVGQGFRGPIWTVDGTAVYSQRHADEWLPLILRRSNSAGGRDGAILVKYLTTVAKVQETQRAELESAISLKTKLWVASPAPPPLGSPVLEVMPANGALRPVRFKGAWSSPVPENLGLAPRSVHSRLELGLAKGSANSFWLTLKALQDGPGSLIAANASQAWLAPWNTAVAYVTDGALFVKRILE